VPLDDERAAVIEHLSYTDGMLDHDCETHLARVTRRDVASNPRCPVCKSDDPRGRRPMFHPQHKWAPCWVRLPDGDVCGCEAGVLHPPGHFV